MRQRYDFGYFLSEGFHSIFTHGFMSFAAVCMIICCLLIMGSFTLVAVNAENMFSDLEAENQFTAYIDESLTQEEAKEMMDTQEVIILDVREQDEYDKGFHCSGLLPQREPQQDGILCLGGIGLHQHLRIRRHQHLALCNRAVR